MFIKVKEYFSRMNRESLHCPNVRVVFKSTGTVHTRNKSHAKLKAFTVGLCKHIL